MWVTCFLARRFRTEHVPDVSFICNLCRHLVNHNISKGRECINLFAMSSRREKKKKNKEKREMTCFRAKGELSRAWVANGSWGQYLVLVLLCCEFCSRKPHNSQFTAHAKDRASENDNKVINKSGSACKSAPPSQMCGFPIHNVQELFTFRNSLSGIISRRFVLSELRYSRLLPRKWN